FYPIHWQALEQIAARYRVRAVVLAAPAPELPSVHEAHGTAEPAGGAIEVRRMPSGSRRERIAWLARQLRELRPDAVWVQEEPLALPFVESDFVVGFAGRIVEEKGWRVLSEALGALPGEFKLAVAGDGSDVDALRDSLPGRVHFAGLLPKEQLWSFYTALDCLAVPSLSTPRWKEQLGGTLLDGLAMGVPVVASASGGLPDAMGEAGVLVPEGDAAALAEALQRLRDDE